jgi:hypothetical protein
MVRWLIALLLLLLAAAGCNSRPAELAPAGLDVAQQLAELEALPTPHGVDAADWAQLKGALAAYLVKAYPSGKIPAATTTSILAATQLTLDDANDRLQWRFASPGDYDQNGEVNISDLSPLGARLGEGGGPFPFASVLSVIDGDNNGEINISDITPIGANIGKQVLQYNVFVSYNQADYPASNGAVSALAPLGFIGLGAAVGNKTTDRLLFEVDLAARENAFYWVRPSDGTDNGTPSNPVEPLFTTITLDSGGLSGDVGEFCSLAIVNGNPAISYYDRTSGDLLYIRSTTPTGTAPEDWSAPVRIDDGLGTDVGQHTSLAVINGNPALAYYDVTAQDLHYVRSTTVDGLSFGDWTQRVELDTAGNVGHWNTLLEVAGSPAIFYYDESIGDGKYARASTADGAALADWTTFPVDGPQNSGRYGQMDIINGNPAAAFYSDAGSDVLYTRANSTDGMPQLAWPGLSLLIDGLTTQVGDEVDLEEVMGNPAIAFRDFNTFGDEKLRYVYCSTPDGMGVGDWPASLLLDDGGGWISLKVIDGNPAIAHRSDTVLKYMRSATPTGETAADWDDRIVLDRGALPTGEWVAMVEINGRPAICYYDRNVTGLKYTYME